MKTKLPERVRLMVYHWRHCAVITPPDLKAGKLSERHFEASQQFGEEHAAAMTGKELVNPEAKCRQWLHDNGYTQVGGTEYWTRP